MQWHQKTLTRRRFVSAATASLFTRFGVARPGRTGNAIGGIRVGEPIVVPGNYGDTWITTWADDGNLYAPVNDGFGFDIPRFFDQASAEEFSRDEPRWAQRLTPDQKREFAARFRHMLFTQIQGVDPKELRGSNVSQFAEFAQQDHIAEIFADKPTKAADGRSWKSSGCAYIDGALYCGVARHRYPDDFKTIGIRQSAINSSLIASNDLGRTWRRSAQENLESPMFPGSTFATPYFVDYGRRRSSADGAERYIYAISNDGFWDNGDFLILARVLRDRISHLSAADWEFFCGGDGILNKNWTRDSSLAKPVLERAGRLGETGAAYLPSRGRYLMVGWYYPAGSGFLEGSSKVTVWDFYESPHPWGPWERIGSKTWTPRGYYCPGVCPKFQSSSRVYVTTVGDFYSWWDCYHLTFIPVDIASAG
jgi:hypothetical protein